MRVYLPLLILWTSPASAQPPRRLDALVDAAREILVAEAQRPHGQSHSPTLWCVTPTAPDRRVRVHLQPRVGQWLWCVPVDAPPWLDGPWR